jgi:DNA-directed RNA polymerase specialized sigma24 family protein
MSDVTHSSMHDARDAEDNRLLENEEIDLLLAGWVETIDTRCVAKMRGPVGHDVAQAVCERLWKELKAGKHRSGRWPFRVIVHQVIGYVCAGWYEKGWSEGELIEIDGAAEGTFTGDVELQLTLAAFVLTLPPADGEVARLWLLERLEIDEIAERLGKLANAIYQARSRISPRLREWLES